MKNLIFMILISLQTLGFTYDSIRGKREAILEASAAKKGILVQQSIDAMPLPVIVIEHPFFNEVISTNLPLAISGLVQGPVSEVEYRFVENASWSPALGSNHWSILVEAPQNGIFNVFVRGKNAKGYGPVSSNQFIVSYLIQNTNTNVILESPLINRASQGEYTNLIIVSWNPSSNAIGYEIQRSTSSSGPFSNIGFTNSTNFIDWAPIPFVYNYYRILSTNGVGARSQVSACTQGYVAPFGPTPLIKVSKGLYPTTISVDWAPVPGCWSYALSSSASPATGFNSWMIVNATNYMDMGVASGTGRYYQVKGISSGYSGVPATSDAGFAGSPLAPTLYSVSTNLPGGIQLVWGTSVDSSGYYLYRYQTNAPVTNVVAVLVDTNFLDTTVAVSNGYDYFVKSFSSNCGFTAASASMRGMALPLPPPVPPAKASLPNALASRIYGDRVVVQWQAFTGWDSGSPRLYYLRRTTNILTPYDYLQILSNAIVFTNFLANNGPFYYQVIVSNGANEFSTDPVLGHLGLTPPADVQATRGDFSNSIQLSWDAVAGASTYHIQRSKGTTNAYSNIAVVSAVNQYTDSQIVTAQNYVYRILASNEVFGATLPSDLPAWGYGSPMPAPGSPNASKGLYQDHVTFSWNSVTGSTGYIVSRANILTGAYTDVMTNSAFSTTYNDYGFTDTARYGRTNLYRVRSLGTPWNGNLSVSDFGYVSPDPIALTSVSMGSYTDRIVLNYSTNAAASQYFIYRNGALVGVSGSNSFTDTNVTPGNLYYYQVRYSNNLIGYSSLSASNQGIVRYARPNLSVSKGTNSTYVHVGWNVQVPGTTYEIWRGTSLISSNLLTTVTGQGTYQDTTAVLNTVYNYYIKAKGNISNLCEEGAAGPVTGWLGLAAPAFISVQSSNTNLKVFWSSVAGSSGYYLYKSMSPALNGFVSKIATVGSTNFLDTNVAPGRTYFYRVSPYNASGNEGSLSADASMSCTPGSRSTNASEALANSVAGSSYFQSSQISYGSSTFGSNWFVDRLNAVASDSESLCSGPVAASGSNWFALTFSNNSSNVSFSWKVSSEPLFDTLSCYLDGVPMGEISGDTGWLSKSFSFTPGFHTLKWIYKKDDSANGGQDAAWVDQVNVW